MKNPQLTFDQFSKANRARCESPEGFNHAINSWPSSDWMTAVLGELGEAANVVKKLNRCRDNIPGNKLSADELRAQLRKELGSQFICLDLAAQSLGFTIADAAVEVFAAKSKQIGYPWCPFSNAEDLGLVTPPKWAAVMDIREAA